MKITYKLLGNCPIEGTPLDTIMKIVDDGEKVKNYFVPCNPENTDYENYLRDIEEHGMSIVSCDDCGDGVVNSKTMWQYVENAEELLATKYGSDPNYQKLLYDLKCDRFAKAKQGLSPYYNIVEATKVINSTPQDIQDAMRHIPMRS